MKVNLALETWFYKITNSGTLTPRITIIRKTFDLKRYRIYINNYLRLNIYKLLILLTTIAPNDKY